MQRTFSVRLLRPPAREQFKAGFLENQSVTKKTFFLLRSDMKRSIFDQMFATTHERAIRGQIFKKAARDENKQFSITKRYQTEHFGAGCLRYPRGNKPRPDLAKSCLRRERAAFHFPLFTSQKCRGNRAISVLNVTEMS